MRRSFTRHRLLQSATNPQGIDRAGALPYVTKPVLDRLRSEFLGPAGGRERVVALGEVCAQCRAVGAAAAVGRAPLVPRPRYLDELLRVVEGVDGLLALAAG